MALFTTLKRSIGLSREHSSHGETCNHGSLSNLARLLNEILELITIPLGSRDLRNLRLSCKRLAIVTTYLLLPY